jgi:hypothetical protein
MDLSAAVSFSTFLGLGVTIMATLTQQQVQEASAHWANKHYVLANTVADLSTADLNAAIQAIDSAFDMTLNAVVSAGHGAQTIVQALNSVIPAPAANLGNQQKAELVTFAIMKRYGLLV